MLDESNGLRLRKHALVEIFVASFWRQSAPGRFRQTSQSRVHLQVGAEVTQAKVSKWYVVAYYNTWHTYGIATTTLLLLPKLKPNVHLSFPSRINIAVL